MLRKSELSMCDRSSAEGDLAIARFGTHVARLITLGTVALLLNGCASNQSVVGGSVVGIGVVPERRTAEAVVDDQVIGVKANLALSRDKELWKQSHITTLSYNGSLLLVGQVPQDSYVERIDALVAEIPEIKKVYNQVSVGSPISFATRIKDGWITTQVKAKLLASRDLVPNRVSVVTEGGTVYLMGLLTNDECKIVTDLVVQVKGVEEVVTVFDKYDNAG